jgi:hypothetical protein
MGWRNRIALPADASVCRPPAGAESDDIVDFYCVCENANSAELLNA